MGNDPCADLCPKARVCQLCLPKCELHSRYTRLRATDCAAIVVGVMLEKKHETGLRFTKVAKLGEGSYGHVWMVRSNYSFKTYVLKELKERCTDSADRNTALNEADILARLKHKNIVRYKNAYFDGGRLCIIMEYADDGKTTACS